VSDHWSDWSIAPLNSQEYIVWSAGCQVIWLGQQLIVPDNLQGYPLVGLALRLAMTWWAKSTEIFVNGKLVHQGDLFDSTARVLLSAAVVPGAEITVALRLVSPGHDIGALMRSQCLYESTHTIDPGFVADELAIFEKYQTTLAPQKLDHLRALITEIDWSRVSQPSAFIPSLNQLRQKLLSLDSSETTVTHVISPEIPKELAKIPTASSQLKTRNSIQLLGHAHLDLAWLWTVKETWEVAQRTFASVLTLQQEFPDLTFCHSTPALYAEIEQQRPDLFAQIKQQIAAGRWEVVGGLWVEPELNLINGESIVRQVLYAQRYVQEKFGQLTSVAWLPDSFGFCWQLPQILKQGGIDYFVTQKLHWNDTTKFPYGVFWWRSPDGSQIFSLISPPNTTGVMDTNPLTMATYGINWETQTKLKDAFWLPGVGDHGGGPTRDMLQVAQRWQQSPFCPRLEFTTAEAYLSLIRSQELAYPTWNNELYLEFHRGCYTTHADQKRWNRRCEELLYQAELFASLATLITASPYPQLELAAAWKQVLFNQFHDILPGTSIPEVFVAANAAWQEVAQVCSQIREKSLNAIASQIALPPPPQPHAQPLIIFNPLNWQRTEVVTLPLPQTATFTQKWQIYDSSGEKQPCQTSDSALLFLAKNIPAVGYRLFWIGSLDDPKPDNTLLQPEITPIGTQLPHHTYSISRFLNSNTYPPKDWVLENEFLQVIVDIKTGNLSQIFDKVNHREILKKAAGNQLQAFPDQGQYWDAWNIDPNYRQHPLPPTQLKSIQWVEQGQLQQRLRVVRQLGESEFCQDYILTLGSPILRIATTVDWQERQVLVKAAFPLNLEANWATYEIPCGAIQRSTNPTEQEQGDKSDSKLTTPDSPPSSDQAKWEVSALRWADLSDQDYGVSLLNNCKYGYDAQPSQLRLTLLRSPCWPDPEADRGMHQFTYALYPHKGNWQSAGTVRRGYELNMPLEVINYPDVEVSSHRPLKPMGQLLDLQAENLILMAFKPTEDTPQQWILRCYECHGSVAELSLKSDLNLAIAHPIDLLEQPSQTSETLSDRQTIRVNPWKIATFLVTNDQESAGVQPPTSNY